MEFVAYDASSAPRGKISRRRRFVLVSVLTLTGDSQPRDVVGDVLKRASSCATLDADSGSETLAKHSAALRGRLCLFHFYVWVVSDANEANG